MSATTDRPGRRGRGLPSAQGLLASPPVALLRAAHPRQALLVTLAVTAAAAMAGRSTREVGLVLVTVLVGQVVLGWHNDVVDARRDRSHARTGKPIAQGLIDRGTVAFAVACGVLLVVPLSIANGVVAGLSHLALLAVAMLTNHGLLRRTRFSYLPWMASFALFPAFLSYGSYAGQAMGPPPSVLMTLLAALLGIGVHVLRALPGLVDDNKDRIRSFPLTLALRIGAARLLLLGGLYTAVIGAAILTVAATAGLSR